MSSKWAFCGLALVAGFFVCAEARAAGATIDEVWMRHGGARLYYDALIEPKQMDMQGVRRKDPALIRNLPPITEMKPQTTRRRSSTARSGSSSKEAKPVVSASQPGSQATSQAGSQLGGLPAGQATSARPALSSVAAPQSAKAAAPTPDNGARAAAAQGNAGSLGGLEPARNNNDVFVPPPKTVNVPGGAAASSGAATSSAGRGGSMTGAGQTSR